MQNVYDCLSIQEPVITTSALTKKEMFQNNNMKTVNLNDFIRACNLQIRNASKLQINKLNARRNANSLNETNFTCPFTLHTKPSSKSLFHLSIFMRINYWRVKKKSQTKLALNTLLTWILINANEKKSLWHYQFLALSNKAQNNLLFTPFSLLSLGVRRDRGVTLDTIHTWVLKMVK